MEDRRDCKSEKGRRRGRVCLIGREAWPLFSSELLIVSSFNYKVKCHVCCDSYFLLNYVAPVSYFREVP